MALDCDIGRSIDVDDMHHHISMGDYIEKLDNTFIYPPYPILKPIQQQIWKIFFWSLQVLGLDIYIYIHRY